MCFFSLSRGWSVLYNYYYCFSLLTVFSSNNSIYSNPYSTKICLFHVFSLSISSSSTSSSSSNQQHPHQKTNEGGCWILYTYSYWEMYIKIEDKYKCLCLWKFLFHFSHFPAWKELIQNFAFSFSFYIFIRARTTARGGTLWASTVHYGN